MLQKASSDSFREAAKRKMSITSSAATMRVLSVLRHWVTKHGQVALSEIMDNSIRRICCVVSGFWREPPPEEPDNRVPGGHPLHPHAAARGAQGGLAAAEVTSWTVIKITLINDNKCIFGLNINYFSRMLTKEEPAYNIINLEEILAPSTVRFHSKKYFSTMFLSLLKF